MDTKPMSQVLKTAPEVTSLTSADSIIGRHENGDAFSVGRGNLMKQTLSAGMDADATSAGRWIRILTLSSLSVGMAWLTNTWSMNRPIPLCFIYYGSHLQNDSDTVVQVLKSSPYFKKLRVVYPASGAYYLEVFVVTLRKEDKLTLSVAGNLVVPDSFSAGNVPSGATVKEFNITTSVFGGGGKPLFINTLRNLAERRVA